MQVAPSRSRILRSTHIVHVVIEHVAPSPAAPVGGSRAVSVTLRLVEVFKGRVAQTVGAVAVLNLTQGEDPMGWGAAPSGVWTRHAIAPASAWVAFAESSAEDLATLLNDPACTLVDAADEALSDVRLARDLDDPSTPAVDALQRARDEAPRLHHLGVEYLWARFGASVAHDLAALDGFLALVAAPALSYPAREFLLSELGTALDGAPREARARYVAALFEVLASEAASAHHDNLVGVRIPSAIGLQGLRVESARALFADHAEARDVARRAVASYHGPRDTAALRAWLWAESSR